MICGPFLCCYSPWEGPAQKRYSNLLLLQLGAPGPRPPESGYDSFVLIVQHCIDLGAEDGFVHLLLLLQQSRSWAPPVPPAPPAPPAPPVPPAPPASLNFLASTETYTWTNICGPHHYCHLNSTDGTRSTTSFFATSSLIGVVLRNEGTQVSFKLSRVRNRPAAGEGFAPCAFVFCVLRSLLHLMGMVLFSMACLTTQCNIITTQQNMGLSQQPDWGGIEE